MKIREPQAIMGNTWGRKVPLKEVLRKNKREINKAVRELDRERANLEKQEQKLVADIKKYAKDGQMGPVKIMAKDLVRTRTYITKFIELRSHLNAVALKLQTVKSQEAMARAMKSVARGVVRTVQLGASTASRHALTGRRPRRSRRRWCA